MSLNLSDKGRKGLEPLCLRSARTPWKETSVGIRRRAVVFIEPAARCDAGSFLRHAVVAPTVPGYGRVLAIVRSNSFSSGAEGTVPVTGGPNFLILEDSLPVLELTGVLPTLLSLPLPPPCFVLFYSRSPQETWSDGLRLQSSA